MIFLRLRSIVNTARKRGWNVIGILGGSPERFKALDYPAEVLEAFETYLKGDGVDVEELDFVDKKDKAAKQSLKWGIRDSGVISWEQRSSPSPPRYGFRQSVRHATEKGDACASFLGNMTEGARWHCDLAQIALAPCASFECSGNYSAYSDSHPNRERALKNVAVIHALRKNLRLGDLSSYHLSTT